MESISGKVASIPATPTPAPGATPVRPDPMAAISSPGSNASPASPPASTALPLPDGELPRLLHLLNPPAKPGTVSSPPATPSASLDVERTLIEMLGRLESLQHRLSPANPASAPADPRTLRVLLSSLGNLLRIAAAPPADNVSPPEAAKPPSASAAKSAPAPPVSPSAAPELATAVTAQLKTLAFDLQLLARTRPIAELLLNGASTPAPAASTIGPVVASPTGIPPTSIPQLFAAAPVPQPAPGNAPPATPIQANAALQKPEQKQVSLRGFQQHLSTQIRPLIGSLEHALARGDAKTILAHLKTLAQSLSKAVAESSFPPALPTGGQGPANLSMQFESARVRLQLNDGNWRMEILLPKNFPRADLSAIFTGSGIHVEAEVTSTRLRLVLSSAPHAEPVATGQPASAPPPPPHQPPAPKASYPAAGVPSAASAADPAIPLGVDFAVERSQPDQLDQALRQMAEDDPLRPDRAHDLRFDPTNPLLTQVVPPFVHMHSATGPGSASSPDDAPPHRLLLEYHPPEIVPPEGAAPPESNRSRRSFFRFP